MTLRMPSSYVDIDREEMEYVDGGNLGICSHRDILNYQYEAIPEKERSGHAEYINEIDYRE